MKKCAFCPRDAVEDGGEHIWDDWLNKALPKTRYRARKRYALDSPTIQYDTYNLDERLAVVCENCNSGWMSVLTNKTKQSFSRAMLDGEPFSLNGKDADLLAAFTFMKAVVTNQTIEAEPFFTRAAREKFRISLVIPPWTKVWGAAYHGESRMSTKNNLSIVSTSTPGPLYGMEFYSFTYVVGKLALQLLAPRWKYIRDRGRPLLSLSPNAYWDQATIFFWPYREVPISWPPAKHIGDDTIQRFIDRFNDPVNLSVPAG
jgi:hypothetical protein